MIDIATRLFPRTHYEAAPYGLKFPCRIWDGARSGGRAGRGFIREGTKMLAVSRVALEASLGRPLTAYALHHCDRPFCVEPSHLYEGSPRQNAKDAVERGLLPPPPNKGFRKTHCIHGHPLSGVNLYVTPKGLRSCRQCQRAGSVRYRERQRAA